MSIVWAFTVPVIVLLMLVTKGVVAQGDQQCRDYLSDIPLFPGSSCEDIYHKNQQIRDQPGNYWILTGPSRVYCGMNNYSGPTCEDIYVDYSATRNNPGWYRVYNNWAYCDMVAIAGAFSRGELISRCVGMGGVWRRIGGFDMAAGDSCPSSWSQSSSSGTSFCRTPGTDGGCYSVFYSSGGRNYQKVCGRASGYQYGSPDAFRDWDGTDIFDYFEGISITHANPRQHIWTYAAGLTDHGSGNPGNCPCAANPGTSPSAFVGSDYYCESGAGSGWRREWYLSNVLWDGLGCSASAGSTCCSNSNLPWFYKQLSSSTQDDIEVRLCVDQSTDDEDLGIASVEIYIQ